MIISKKNQLFFLNYLVSDQLWTYGSFLIWETWICGRGQKKFGKHPPGWLTPKSRVDMPTDGAQQPMALKLKAGSPNPIHLSRLYQELGACKSAKRFGQNAPKTLQFSYLMGGPLLTYIMPNRNRTTTLWLRVAVTIGKTWCLEKEYIK